MNRITCGKISSQGSVRQLPHASFHAKGDQIDCTPIVREDEEWQNKSTCFSRLKPSLGLTLHRITSVTGPCPSPQNTTPWSDNSAPDVMNGPLATEKASQRRPLAHDIRHLVETDGHVSLSSGEVNRFASIRSALVDRQ
jgi:hypothetical protein